MIILINLRRESSCDSDVQVIRQRIHQLYLS